MSKQWSFALALALLLVAAALRLGGLASIPPGLSTLEAQDAQIAELVRFGQVEVLYELEGGGREGLYHVLLSAITAFIGNGPLGYRLPSVWFGLLSLAFIYTLGRRLYGRVAGLAAMAAFATPLWSILLARTVSREALLMLMVVAGLTALARALPVYRRPNFNPSTLPFAVLGLLLGLGFYVHPAHYIFVLGIMIFIAYMIFTRQPMSRRTLGYIGFAIVILMIVAVPYFAVVLRLPDLSGAARLARVFDSIAGAGIGQTVLNSLGGVFLRGDADILHNLPGRPYTDPLSGLLIVWGMVVCGRRSNEPRYALPLLMLLVLLPVALFAPNSPNFAGYVVILPLLALFFGVGAKRLIKVAPRQNWGSAAVMLLVLGSLFWHVTGLTRWALRGDVQAAYHSRSYALALYLDGTVSDTATVVCSPVLPNYPTWSADADNPATLLALMMNNPDEARIRYAECGSGLVFTNGGEHQQLIALQEDSLTSFHPNIQAWVGRGDLISEGVPQASVVSMIVSEVLGDTIGRFITTAPAGYAPESPGGVALAQLPVGFEGNLTFLGYERSDADNIYSPGDIVTVITYWRVDGPLPDTLNIFTHMLFDAGTLVTQTDTISVQTQRLRPRDVFMQVTFVTLPDDVPEGTYQISVGAYQSATENRLSVLDNGVPRGSRLFLNELQVVPAQNTVNSGEEG